MALRLPLICSVFRTSLSGRYGRGARLLVLLTMLA